MLHFPPLFIQEKFKWDLLLKVYKVDIIHAAAI